MARPRSSDPTPAQLYEAVARAATLAERKRCHDIALAIDSGRGNEKEIAKAIMDANP